MNDRLHREPFLEARRLVETHTGIRLPPIKRLMLEGRLRRRVRALGLATSPNTARRSFNEAGSTEEFEHVVDCVTTNKTDFFREPEHFVFLRDRRRSPRCCSCGARRTRRSSSGAPPRRSARRPTRSRWSRPTFSGWTGGAFPCSAPTSAARSSTEARRAIYPLAFADPIPRRCANVI